MTDTTPELIEPPSTDIPIEAVEAVLREQYGLSGQVFPVDGRQNPYFLIDNGHMRYLLKVSPADLPLTEIEAEHALMRHILRSPDGPRIPEPVATRDGIDTISLPLGGEERQIRLLTFIHGTAPQADETLSDQAIAAFGALSAYLVRSLEDFDHPILEREPAGDLRKAGPHTVALLSAVPDHETRDAIAKTMVAALKRIQPLIPGLRIAAVHHDLAADAVVGDRTEGGWLPSGLTDFTGIAKGWLVGGLAHTCTYLLANRDGNCLAVLPAIRAYHEIYPLTLVELEALWPLIVARTGILAAEAENRRESAPDDPEMIGQARRCRKLLDAATSVSPALMFAAILDATDMVKPLPDIGRLLPEIDPETIRLVDLGVTSPLLYGGNWTEADNDWKLLARIAWETGRASTRYGEYRLSKSLSDPHSLPESFALHIDVCVTAGTPAVAPFAGLLKSEGTRLMLVGRDLTLHVEGLDCPIAEDTELAAGDPLGTVGGAENSVGGLRLGFCRDADLVPPLFCSADRMGLWSRLCPSPSALLGLDADAPPPRERDQVVRGWNEYLFDATGRCMLDFSADASLIGHGHPRVAEAAYRQLLLLDAPSSSEAQHLLLQRLKDLAPEGLGSIVVLQGHREALAYATNLARSHSGRNAIVHVGCPMPPRAADPLPFHADGLETAKAMVEQGDTAALLLAGIPSTGKDLTALLETLALNDGLVIIDETQTGWGRLGHHGWGFEAQGLSPDIVFAGLPGERFAVLFARDTLAAAMTLEPAPRPVDCAMATAVLEIRDDDTLRDNARSVGDPLKSALQALAAQHDSIQAVSGSSLYLALQFADKETATKIHEDLRKHGILTSLGHTGDLLITPPMCVSRESADMLVERLKTGLSES